MLILEYIFFEKKKTQFEKKVEGGLGAVRVRGVPEEEGQGQDGREEEEPNFDPHQPAQGMINVLAAVNLLADPTSVSASSFCPTYAQKTRNVTVRKPAERVSGGERLEERQYTAAVQYILICF